MTKKLLVVAGSGLILAILLLSAAWAVGGKAVATAAHLGGWHYTFADDRSDDGPAGARSLSFDPAAPLTIDAPVELHFRRGDHAAMTVSGSAPMLAALRWQHNSLSLQDMPFWGRHHTLDVEIVAPRLPPLTFAGAGDLSLEQIDQDELKLAISGAGDVTASGRVRAVTADISGAGNVDLGELNATDATVDASGIGNVDVKAGGKVDLAISGAGNVTLHARPTQLTSRITGIGSVDQDY